MCCGGRTCGTPGGGPEAVGRKNQPLYGDQFLETLGKRNYRRRPMKGMFEKKRQRREYDPGHRPGKPRIIAGKKKSPGKRKASCLRQILGEKEEEKSSGC